MDYEKFMESALKEGAKGLRLGLKPFGTCLVKGNQRVASGHNTVYVDNDVINHAEINAIRAACRKMKTNHLYKSLKGVTLFSTCEPCLMCIGACKFAGIEKIIYGISDKDRMRLERGLSGGTKAAGHFKKNGMIFLSGVLSKECEAAFRGWTLLDKSRRRGHGRD